MKTSIARRTALLAFAAAFGTGAAFAGDESSTTRANDPTAATAPASESERQAPSAERSQAPSMQDSQASSDMMSTSDTQLASRTPAWLDNEAGRVNGFSTQD